MLRILLLSLITVNLVGCSTVIKVLAHHYNTVDECQSYNKQSDWKPAWHCHGSDIKHTIYNARGERVGFIR